MIEWVSIAWESIDPKIIVKSFLKCGISNSVDGSEDSLIWVEISVTTDANYEEDNNNDDDPFQDIDEIIALQMMTTKCYIRVDNCYDTLLK